jgi:hypothetical protein
VAAADGESIWRDLGLSPGVWQHREHLLRSTGGLSRAVYGCDLGSNSTAVAAYRLLPFGLASVLAAPDKVAASIGAAWSATNRRARRYS